MSRKSKTESESTMGALSTGDKSEERLLEAYRQFRTHQDKYIYFLLAATGAAIALAINRTQNVAFTRSLIPWGVAVLLWGASFACGCRYLANLGSGLWSNYELIRVERGEHLEAQTPDIIRAASEGIRDALMERSKKTVRLGWWQFTLFIAGAVSFIIWHVIQIYLHTRV